MLQAVCPGCEIITFTDPLLSAKHIWNNPVDIVFAEERMRPANGVDLLKVIRARKPDMPVIILAEDDHMREQTKNLAADGYWIKPVGEEALRAAKAILEQEEEKHGT